MKPEFTQKFTPLAQRLLKLKGSPETVPKIAQPTPTLITGARTLEEFIERSGGHFLGLLPETLEHARCEYDPHFRHGDKIIPALKFPLGGGKYFWVSTSDINLRGVEAGSPKIYVANRIEQINFVFVDVIDALSALQELKNINVGLISLSGVDEAVIARIKNYGVDFPRFIFTFPNDDESQQASQNLAKALQKYFPAVSTHLYFSSPGWRKYCGFKKIPRLSANDILTSFYHKVEFKNDLPNILTEKIGSFDDEFKAQEQELRDAQKFKSDLFAL